MIALYLVLLISMGSLLFRGQEKVDDFAVAGRSMHWFPLTLAIIAAEVSAISYQAAPAWILQKDLQYVIGGMILYPLLLPLVSVIFITVYYRMKLTSVFEFLETRFGTSVRLLVVLLFCFSKSGWLSTAMYATSIPMHRITGWPQWICILGLGTIATFYAFGGLRTVIWTECAQFVVLVGGILVVIAFTLVPYHGNIFRSLQVAHDLGHTRMFNFSMSMTDEITVLNLFLFWAVAIISTQSSDQLTLQRYFAARSLRQCMKAAFGAGIVHVPVLILLSLMGLGFVSYQAVHPDIFKGMTDSNEAFTIFVLRVLPMGLRGLVMAGIFAATLSVVDSALNSLATSTVIDIYQRYFHRTWKSDRHYLIACRCATVFWGMVSVFPALFLAGHTAQLFQITGIIGGYFASPVAGVFVLGLLTKRANSAGVFGGIILGALTNWYVEQHTIFGMAEKISWIWYSVISFASTIILGYLLSFPMSFIFPSKQLAMSPVEAEQALEAEQSLESEQGLQEEQAI